MSSRRTRACNEDVVNLVSSDAEDIEIDSDAEPAQCVQKGRSKPVGASQRSALGALLMTGSQRPTSRPATQTSLEALLKPSKLRAALRPPPATEATEPAAASTADLAAASEGSWEELYAPHSEDDLVVNKKKVHEVKTWLEYHLMPAPSRNCRVLLLTGPAGCGKSTVLKLLAKQLNFDLVEWTTPTPTLWSEHTYQDGVRLPYRSKLDEFEMFVARSKFAALPLFSSSSAALPALPGSQPSQQASSSGPAGKLRKLLVLDDLPHAADAAHRQRLVKALTELVAGARGPVVIIATEPGSAGSTQGSGASAAAGSIKGLHKDVLSALEALGCQTQSFNPVPPTSIAKHLTKIAAQRSLSIDSATISSIAQMADGDLRNAILTMQVMCMGQRNTKPTSSTAPSKSRAKKGTSSKRDRAGKEAAAQQAASAAVLAAAQRDMGLNLFHFLGKVLYNKRDGDDEQAAGSAAPSSKSRKTSKAATASKAALQQASSAAAAALKPLKQQYMRPPLRYDPEGILQQSGMDALPVVAFLHENYTEFIESDAMEDVAAAAGYLSDAAFMASHRNSAAASSSGSWAAEEGVASTLTNAAAGSTAVRGLLFANAHPAPRRWMPLRSPMSNQVDKASSSNLAVLQGTVSTAATLALSSSSWVSLECYAAGVLVYLRQLVNSPQYSAFQILIPTKWSYVWNGGVHERWQHPGGNVRAEAPQLGWLQDGMDGGDGEDDDEIVDD